MKAEIGMVRLTAEARAPAQTRAKAAAGRTLKARGSLEQRRGSTR